MKNMYTSVLSRWLMLLLLLSSQTLLAQTAPTIQWQRVLPSVTEVKAVQTPNGDIITTNGSSVLKLSGSNGTEQWKTTLPTTYLYSIGIDLAPLPDGGVTVLARDPYKWLLIRLSASGTVQWLKPFRNITQSGELTQTKLTRVIQAADGGYVVMGSTQYGRDGSNTDLYRFDTDGNLVRSQGLGYIYPNAPRPVSVGNSLIKTSDGSYVVVGVTQDGLGSGPRGWAAKLNSQLSVVWQNKYEQTRSFIDAMQATDGQNYLVTGITTATLPSFAGILALDANGQLIEGQRSDTQTGDTYFFSGNASIASIPGSSPVRSVLLTSSGGPSDRGNDFRLSTPGLTLSLGGSGTETASSIIATPDGGFLLAGTTTSTDGDVVGKTDNTPSGWLVKLAPVKPLTINAPTYDCSTGAITFNTSGGDGSPITFSAPGISRPSLTSITGTVEQGLRNDPKPIFIVANQSGQRTTYSFDLKAACTGTTPTPTPTMHPDMQPLVDLYNATNGPSWKNKTNWLTGNSPCNWFGVSCNANGRVTEINFGYNNLNGTLPSSLGNLSELQRLVIFTEPLLSGTLPASLENLSKLQLLEIEYTQISGSIPESLGNLKQLTQLFLAKNELSGSIPESLGNLSSLKTLYLFGNQLTGNLPNSFATLPQIQSLHLYANRLSGCIPSVYTALCGKDVQLSSNVGLPGGGDFAAFCANPSQNCGPNKLLTLTQPTYNCSTGAIAFNFANGDGSSITYTAPGITRSSVTSNSGTVEQGLRNDPKTITITATQSGYSTSYSFDLKAACNGTTPTPTPPATGNALSLSAYVGNCASQTPLIAFKTTGGDGTPITFSAPGVVRRFPTDSSGTIESGLRNDPKPITISALQSGKSVSYVVDLPKICDPTPIIGKPLDNLTLTAGQGTYTIIAQSGINFYDPYVLTDITGHHARATYMSFRSTGLPDSLYAQNYDDGGNNYYFRLFGKPTTAGVYTVTVTATVNARSVSTTFTITVLPANAQPVTPTPPATGNTLTLTQPTYDCSTGAFTFNYAGGNGSPVEFQAAGITGWTTNPNQFVDKDSRTANDVKPFTLMARQNGQMVTYTWDLKAACGRSARMAATEAGQVLELTVKGNPVGNTAVVEIRGAEGQAVSLDLLNASGHVLEQRHIEQAGAVDEQRFDLQRQPTGLLFLRAQSGQQKQTVKLIKQ